MDRIADTIILFLITNFPSWKAIAVGGPLGLAWAWSCLFFAGYLKRHQGMKTGYTRKAFHFLIFSTVAIIQWAWGTPVVCLFGGMCSLVIFYAVWRGPGDLLYEAMAREKDEPHRTYFVVVPYFATLIGGLASNILFGPAAIAGYLVTGLGDAVGEPVGTRFGKHTYRVPSLSSVKAVRSWEGSAAVLAMSFVALAAAVSVSPDFTFTSHSLAAIPLIGVAATSV